MIITVLQSGRGGAHRDAYIEAMESSDGDGIYGLLIMIVVAFLFFVARAKFYENRKK